MPTSNRANWAATAPWAGIQNKPAFIDHPSGKIQISDVQGLQAELDSKLDKMTLAKVASTGQYSDLLGLPALGSAAFVDTSNFLPAWTPKTLQLGIGDLVAGTERYEVTFSVAMKSVPKIQLQVMVSDGTSLSDGTGDNYYAMVNEDSLTTTGFRFKLSNAPAFSTGRIFWIATVEDETPGTTFTPLTPPPPGVIASGGVETTVGGFKIHTFLSTGNLTVTQGGEIDYLVVGGGGGGGAFGGGGGGGFQKLLSQMIGTGVFPAVVGTGGAGVAGGAHGGEQGGDGVSSSFNGTTAAGGGGGGAFSDTLGAGRDGASGGGGGTLASPPYTGQLGGSATDGFAGGAGVTGATAGGGGGGHSALGGDGSGSIGGVGGDGTADSISGASLLYAAGGGGSGLVTGGAGGSSIGGNGGAYNGDTGPGATAPTANTGSGGGGKYANAIAAATAGASGIVIITYPI